MIGEAALGETRILGENRSDAVDVSKVDAKAKDAHSVDGRRLISTDSLPEGRRLVTLTAPVRRSLLILLLLLAIDVALTVFSYRSGTLWSGRSPSLDLWDLAKALTLSVVLLMTARRVSSRGLVVVGLGALLVGLAGSTHLHGWLASWIFPGSSSGMGKFVVLVVSAAAMVMALFLVKDSWPQFPKVRRVTILLLMALLFAAGVLDIADPFRGAGLIEESAERAVMSLALALAMSIQLQN